MSIMDILLSRQPIFDARDQVAAYELFYRASTRSASAGPPPSPDRILADAVLGVGLDRVAEKGQVYLSVTPELIVREMVRVLPAARVVLQLDAESDPTPELLEALRQLARDGYALAVSNVRGPVSPALARLASVAKVDVRAFDDAGLAEIAASLRAQGVRLLAEHLEHRTAQQHCIALGIELFQGLRFCRPQTLVRRDVPLSHIQTYRLLKMLRTPDSTDAEIEELLRRDVGLTYKLLRIVNSAAMGGREIWSIGHAIRLMGRQALARWVTLLLLSDIGDSGVTSELTRTALTRARLCEMLATDAGLRSAGQSLFLVGLLSLLDQLLAMPMEELVTEMELAPDVRDALLYRTDFFGEVLSLVEAYEEGTWEATNALAGSLGIPDELLTTRYLESLAWATAQDPNAAQSAA
jgi:EAL and modified HD-GYP domain-containing signal transduction protein